MDACQRDSVPAGRYDSAALKMIVCWLTFIAVMIQAIGFLFGVPNMPEVFDMAR